MSQSTRFRILISLAFALCAQFCAAAEDTWIEVKSPHFVVISNAAPKQARRTARSFEQFRSLLQATFPKLRVDPGSPLIIFAVKDSKGLKALLPTQQEKGAAQPAGIFMGGSERNYVVLRTDVLGEQGYHVIYHEYVHMVMNLNYRRLPVWLSEGLAEFFGYASISEGTSALGDPNPDLLSFLQLRSLMPLRVLVRVTQDSPYYHQQDKVQIFYAQSWALTHYLMIGDKRAHAGQLIEFLRLLRMDVPEEEAAERALGDLDKLEQNLSVYIRQNIFYHYQVPVKLSEKEDQYGVRTLSPAESLALRGEVLVHANRLDDARALLEQAMQLDSRSALANEGMGMLYMRRQNQELARKYFAAAAELDSQSFLAHFYAAALAYEKMDSKSAEEHLRITLAINPNFAPAYRNLSQILMMQDSRLQEAHELAKKAMDLDPVDLGHRFNVGSILIKMDNLDEASKQAEALRALARNEVERSMAESLRSMIQTRRQAMIGEMQRGESLKEHPRKTEEQLRKDREMAEQLQKEIEDWKEQEKAGPIKTGAAGKVAGLVQSVKCSYPSVMDIVIDANGKQQKLRAQNYYQVQYWAVGAPGGSALKPCEDLKGKRVEIEFLSVSGREFSGLIQTVAIEK